MPKSGTSIGRPALIHMVQVGVAQGQQAKGMRGNGLADQLEGLRTPFRNQR